MSDRTKRLEELKAKKQKLQEIKNKLGSTPTKTQNNETVSTVDVDVDNILESIQTRSVVNEQPVSVVVDDEQNFLSVERELTTHLNLFSFDVMPKEVIIYQKGTITDVRYNDRFVGEMEIDNSSDEVEVAPKALNIKAVTNTDIGVTESAKAPEKDVSVEKLETVLFISDEDKKIIVQKPEFQYFLHKNSVILERSLQIEENFNILKDYTQRTESLSMKNHDNISILQEFYFEKVRHRSITDIDWAPAPHSELFAVSYSAPITDNELMVSIRTRLDTGKIDYDGLVLIWSTDFMAEPQFILQCQSPVLSVKFSPFNSKLIVGGTYSGQIVIWDLRLPSSLPVMKSPLSSIGHSHPVYSLSIVGTDKANSIVTASTDGRVCVWNFNNIDQPYSVLELTAKVKNTPVPVYVTALDFPEEEENTFYIGSESGSVLQGCLHGDKSGITRKYSGHYAPVTSCHFHPRNDRDYEDAPPLLLTSSVDWTVNLWSVNQDSEMSGKMRSIKPIFTFEGFGDYVYDAQWSPIHPSLFATVDGTGTISLWNINEKPEVPIMSEKITDYSINRIRWSKDGEKILVGTSSGTVLIVGVGKHGIPNNRNEEFRKLDITVENFAAEMKFLDK